MGLFGRGKKKDATAPPAEPAAREPDFFSPFWSDWPPKATPAPPRAKPIVTPAPAETEVVVEASSVVEVELVAEPEARPSTNPPPVAGPAVVVQPMRTLSDVPIASPEEQMREAMKRGDWRDARAVAEKILEADPTDLDAYVCVETATQRTREIDQLRLGARDRIVRQSMPDDWLADMAIDPRVAYLLSRIDGVSTIEEIIEISGLAEADAIHMLADLLEDGVIEARTPTRTSKLPR